MGEERRGKEQHEGSGLASALSDIFIGDCN